MHAVRAPDMYMYACSRGNVFTAVMRGTLLPPQLVTTNVTAVPSGKLGAVAGDRYVALLFLFRVVARRICSGRPV